MKAIRVPRINNNDDTVRLNAVLVDAGVHVRKGQSLAEIETDKATFTVEAETEGFVLAVRAVPGDTLGVGSVLMWMGETPDEAVPEEPPPRPEASPTAPPTLKASLLLTQYGIDAARVPTHGDRLTAADVLRFVSAQGLAPLQSDPARIDEPPGGPVAPGEIVKLDVGERGMLRTVLWHRDEAVPGYVEVRYEAGPWNDAAKAFQMRHRLLANPLLGLMAWSLVRLAVERPRLSATIVGGDRYVYRHVNLGFTVQSDSTLYLVVVEEAEKLTAEELVERLATLHRKARKKALSRNETTGSTIAFTSMARWPVSRHIPILPPYTSLIVAHSAAADGQAQLGGTYDHRILTGFDLVQVLEALSRPPRELVGS